MLRILAFIAGVVAAIISGVAAPTLAAGYPSRPVTLIVAYTPGGPSDVLARIIGRQMEKVLRQPIVHRHRSHPWHEIAAPGCRNLRLCAHDEAC